MKAIITNAITSQLLIEINYDGGLRILEPHCHGLSSKSNHVLRAFQVGGYSSTGKMGWKLYDLSKASNLVVSAENFSIRPDYTKGDKGMTSIYYEL